MIFRPQKLVDQLVKLFGSTKSDTVTEGTTHVITNADDDLCAQSPTLKLLQGILMGKFAVTMGCTVALFPFKTIK